MNAASPSRWERFGWAPFILGLTVVCLLLARSGRNEASEDEHDDTEVQPSAPGGRGL